ncbi:MAG: DUF1320 domain-containing protein [Hyphomicrobiaceae bacterium]|nr:DUF1320 domain-containing protein [Hyphomicrobiaceae bacterium]
MAYATDTDLVALHGTDAIDRLGDRTGTGVRDPETVARALDDAAALIDGYIGVRVALPLAPVPAVVKNLSIDIAVYRLAVDAGLLAEDMRKRYEDAIQFLRDVARGVATIPQPKPGDAVASAEASPQSVVIDAAPRLFGRHQLRRL